MNSTQWTKDLVAAGPLIAPSLLAADFARLGEEAQRAQDAGVRVLHVDVMDGHFVPNISIGVPVVESLRRSTGLLLDVHLMISDPQRYADRFIEAGADMLTFHIEALQEPLPLLEHIRSAGVASGLVLNPETPVEAVLPFVDACDVVLTMSVHPGFGGQAFIPEVLEKVRTLRAAAPEGTILSIDGGIGLQTIAQAAEAGVNMFVAGTSFFGADDYAERLRQLTELAQRNGSYR